MGPIGCVRARFFLGSEGTELDCEVQRFQSQRNSRKIAIFASGVKCLTFGVAGLNGFGDMHKSIDANSKLVYISTLVAVAIEKCSTLKSRSISGLLVSATVCWN